MNEIPKQDIRALKCWILSSFFETKTVCKKAEIFQQSTWATKLRKVPVFINDRIGYQIYKYFELAIGALKLWKITSFFIEGIGPQKGWIL